LLPSITAGISTWSVCQTGATSTAKREGKDSSGKYQYRIEEGNVLEDDLGNPLIDQDCVASRTDDPPGIAELFVAWAKQQKLAFWNED